MSDRLIKVAMQLTGSMYELWDKAQVIVALTQTKLGKNIIFVGNKEETIKSIVTLVQTQTQWTEILNLVSVNDYNKDTNPSMNSRNFPLRICAISLPQDISGYVNF